MHPSMPAPAPPDSRAIEAPLGFSPTCVACLHPCEPVDRRGAAWWRCTACGLPHIG